MIQEHNGHWDTGKLAKPLGRGINLQIDVKIVATLIESLKKNNWPLFKPLKENWYRVGDKKTGNKEFLVQDPDGYLLRFAQDLGER